MFVIKIVEIFSILMLINVSVDCGSVHRSAYQDLNDQMNSGNGIYPQQVNLQQPNFRPEYSERVYPVQNVGVVLAEPNYQPVVIGAPVYPAQANVAFIPNVQPQFNGGIYTGQQNTAVNSQQSNYRPQQKPGTYPGQQNVEPNYRPQFESEKVSNVAKTPITSVSNEGPKATVDFNNRSNFGDLPVKCGPNEERIQGQCQQVYRISSGENGITSKTATNNGTLGLNNRNNFGDLPVKCGPNEERINGECREV